MQLLISQEELSTYKSRQLVPLKCEHCSKTFYKPKNEVQCAMTKTGHSSCQFCSRHCNHLFHVTSIEVTCETCNKTFVKLNNQHVSTKHHFCCQSCAAIYSNKHKTSGYRRSKLECYIENRLNTTHQIIFNDRKLLGYELDIYIPTLKLAFEFNGIFHYKPIYKNFQRTVDIDIIKNNMCNKLGIILHVFDVSTISYFKPVIGEHFIKIINSKMEEASELASHTD